MITVTHRFSVTARCPVDENVIDVYVATFITSRLVNVEVILKHVAALSRQTLYQEDLTRHLAEALEGTVTTTGEHSGVFTTVTAEP